ncbi:hypothetical protein PBPMD00_13 [Pinkberry virus LS07-2018-MD00]|nr:hypothetical protein PBPMD00_13 [Pinkberry virus LS07-2018-MD00]
MITGITNKKNMDGRPTTPSVHAVIGIRNIGIRILCEV